MMKSGGTDTIRWLHLSDLHLGCRGESLWQQVREEFEESIRAMTKELGAPDLILFTGDLSYQGAESEFELLDEFLDTLLGWIREEGNRDAQPLIVPVPGNHDLMRPQRMERTKYQFLDNYSEGPENEYIRYFQEDVWENNDVAVIEPLFRNYQAWFERRILPLGERADVELCRSHFPGDFSLRFEPAGQFRLAVVGLNSGWMQYREGDYQGRLELPVEQFHSALGDGGLALFKQADHALLLLHHPPDWLSPAARAGFNEAIYIPARFRVCLHGHMHRGRSETMAVSGGKPRCYFQAPSLFGLQDYGTRHEQRAIGYAWGELGADGGVRVWPLARINRGGGEAAFVPDQSFAEYPARIRPVVVKAPVPPEQPPPLDLRTWLQDQLERTGYINISGIGSGAGRVRTATRYPIERLYTRLRSRGGETLEREDTDLAALIPRHRLLLIEGQPGAGKTTFLRFMASMLIRDRLGIPGPDGASWRQRYLGLHGDQPALIPLFLRLALLESELDDSDRRSDTQDLLVRLLAPTGADEERGAWLDLLRRGEVVLLLDGLDELGDERLRRRVFELLRAACRHWPDTQILVASRPFDTTALGEMGFHHVSVEPFGEAEVHAFINLWVAALYGVEPGTGAEAGRYGERLREAIVHRPRLRRLAANPVMLTCLCVVHWNEGGLPEARARLYRAVLRWLIAARTELRAHQGYNDWFAWRAFAALALAMMGDEQGKRSVLDLETAACAIDPILARDFPDLHPEDRRHRARDWLRFECLGSGVIEEVAGNRLRFWHLTFQEYLAALQLAWLGDGEDPHEDWWPRLKPRLDDAQWRETVELLPGCLLDEGGQGRVDRLLQRVLALRPAEAALEENARCAGILGRLLEPLGAYQYRPPPDIDNAYREILNRSQAIFEQEGAARVPVETRIAVAEALGQGGDPRLRRGRDNLLEVPGLDGLRLGKYPVTVEEYREFIDQGGYEQPGYWDETGWEQRRERGWEAPGAWDEQLATPNRPVVNVSWFEAAAYCAWLAEQWNLPVRLPAEQEWQAAAEGADKRQYPWGDSEPSPEKANYDTNVGRPTPVGIYPAGDGLFGHCDLAGNVWEWCSDVWPEKDLPKELRGQPGGARSLRGGGWGSPAGDLQAAIRVRFPARYRGLVIGFRVAVARASR